MTIVTNNKLVTLMQPTGDFDTNNGNKTRGMLVVFCCFHKKNKMINGCL